jgi:hypothetical protein
VFIAAATADSAAAAALAAATTADAAQVAADLDDDTAALVGDSGTATGAALTATIATEVAAELAEPSFTEYVDGLAEAKATEVIADAGYTRSLDWDGTTYQPESSLSIVGGVRLFFGPVDPYDVPGYVPGARDRWFEETIDVEALLQENLQNRWNADDLGLTEGAAVAAFPDSVGSNDLTIGGSPTFHVSGATNRISFDAVDDYADATGVAMAQPGSLTFIGRLRSGSGTRILTNGITAGTSNTHLIGTSSGGFWTINEGTALQSATTGDTLDHVFTSVRRGSTSELWMDGVLLVTGNAGTAAGAGFSIARNSGTTAFYPTDMIDVLVHAVALDPTRIGMFHTHLREVHGL